MGIRQWVVLFLGLLPALSTALAVGQEPAAVQPDIEVFTRTGCPHCSAAKHFLSDLQHRRPDITIRIYKIDEDPGARERLLSLSAKQGGAPGVPAFFLRGELLVGFMSPETTGARIVELLTLPMSAPSVEREGACRVMSTAPCDDGRSAPVAPADEIAVPLFGHLSIEKLGLPFFTFALGLIDGFNPCSMWVLLFMLSLLASLRDRWKMLIIAGTFVAVEGLAYFAFMAAWMNAFLLIGLSRPTEVILGGIGIAAGMINVKEYWAFHRGITLSIPESAKPGLYARLRGILQAEHLVAAVLGTVVLAILVQVVELLCTAGLPALYTRILTLRQLDWWAYYGYLGIYNLAYMLDDVLVLAMGVITLSQRRLQEREGRWLKLLSGAVMVGLGAVLIFKPEWLAG
jgi:glutaredoxin/cytochrome c biogenesis protein CcdA